MLHTIFQCQSCLEGRSVQPVLLKEFEIEPNVKLECMTNFCYLGGMFGVAENVGEESRARIFHGLSSRSYLPF